MLPVSIGLGLINFNLVLNSVIGSLVSDEAPRAIDAAFRDLHAPAGDVLRRGRDRAVPAARRLAARGDFDGLRAVPGDRHAPDRAAADPGRGGDRRCSPRPIDAAGLRARRVRRGVDPAVAEALFWFSFSLPFAAGNLMLTRDVLLAPAPVAADDAGGRLARRSTSLGSLALYKPFGIAGDRDRHAVSNAALMIAAGRSGCGRALGGLERPGRCARGRAMLRRRRRARGGRLRRLVGAARRPPRPLAARRRSSSRRRRARARQRGLRRGRARAPHPGGAADRRPARAAGWGADRS